ncbi:MAG: DUF1638 domain-containing protein [Aestuariivita sp.]|nr:DUF1638 domain-containing protein [Aestuariivita sp.]MCY4201781.1 DUF1638 domain-containing protein [Aestuariivita sp.]
MSQNEVPSLNDASLTHIGTTVRENGRILLIACGALAREILDLKAANHWEHLDLICLPAIWHIYPDRIVEGVEKSVRTHRARYEKIFVGYGDCGTGGLLAQVCRKLGVEMISGPHCYSFFEGNDQFAEHNNEITAFYLTDFLVRQFDAFVWKPLGLDRNPELLDTYFGHYTKVVYQAQTDDPTLVAVARSHARRLGLEFELRRTRYGDLATTLQRWAKD